MNSQNKPVYRRVLLKLSGEVLRGEKNFGLDFETVKRICGEIKEIHSLGVQIGIVVGGGNIFRGLESEKMGIDRVTGDYMGMLATVINGLAIQNILEKMGIETRVQTAIEMREIAEPFIRRRAISHLEKGRIVIFVCGTGSPYFSTDTASSLRAVEIGADVILKGTKVDGVYNADPQKFKDARMFSTLHYIDLLEKNLRIMDPTAVSMCMDNKIPIVVFNITKPGNLKRIVLGEEVGTKVY